MPYIRSEIPLFIVFRALGFISDRKILEHIVYDFRYTERPNLQHERNVTFRLAQGL